MNKNNVRIERGDILKITSNAYASGTIYAIDGKHQDVRHSAITADQEIILDPYQDVANFRVELDKGSVTYSPVGKSEPSPVKLSSYILEDLPVAAAVDDLELEASVLYDPEELQSVSDKIDELMAALRTAGYIANS